jgi:hypothetical protein
VSSDELFDAPTELEQAGELRLLYRVAVQTRGRQCVRITGTYDDESVVAWGFYGGILTAVAGVAGLAYEGLLGLWNVWPTFLFSFTLVVGLLMMRFGPRSTLDEREIATVDLVERTLTIDADSSRPELLLDDVSEIVFGLTRYPLSGDKKSVRVQAASVLVRVGDRLVTVVNACTDKDSAYGVARFLGSVTGLPVKQVGAGVK